MFFVSILAETNRAPFDLPEAESELVAGFMTEHSASVFVFFFLGEYSSLVLMSALMTIFFFGGYLSPNFFFDAPVHGNHYLSLFLDKFEDSFTFGFKIIFIVFLFI
jgi:NADH:ubiquinone oxidoreductase subunit H